MKKYIVRLYLSKGDEVIFKITNYIIDQANNAEDALQQYLQETNSDLRLKEKEIVDDTIIGKGYLNDFVVERFEIEKTK